MKSLSKATLLNIANLRTDMEAAHETLRDHLDEINALLAAVRDAADAYNAALTDAAETVRDHATGQSEEWRAEHGDDYDGWADAIEESAVDFDEPAFEIDDLDVNDVPYRL